jgi:hypothetical protein
MEEQALDHDEQINVRWAYDDPNPRAEAMRLRNNAQARHGSSAPGHRIRMRPTHMAGVNASRQPRPI